MLREQRFTLPALAYRRLWLNEWTEGSGDALTEVSIKLAVTLGGPVTESQEGWCYVAGLDLGLSRDASAFVVVGKHVGHTEIIEETPVVLTSGLRALAEAGVIEWPDNSPIFIEHAGTGKLRVCSCEIWEPDASHKVNIEAVETAIVAASERYENLRVGCDPWQAAYLMERLRRRGVQVESVDFSASNLKSMCSATLGAFNEGRIELYDEPRLLADLRALRVEEPTTG